MLDMRNRVLRLVSQFTGSAYWCPHAIDPVLIAEEILPAQEQQGDNEDTGSITSEDAYEADAPEQKPKHTGAMDCSGGTIIPRALPSDISPHPRARQEHRFTQIAKE